MKILTPSDINYINYLLFAIKYLVDENGSCEIRTLTNYCSRKTFGARIVDYYYIIKYSKQIGFTIIDKGTICLTNNGKEFIRRNALQFFEITEKQKKYFAEVVIFCGYLQSMTRRLFSIFYSNYEEVTYELSLHDEDIPAEVKPLLFLLVDLQVLIFNEKVFLVAPYFVKHVRDLRAYSTGVTQEELEIFLGEQKYSGFRAEDLVVEYERKRLRNLGFLAEADRVFKIGLLDVDAGYDIKSFNGDNPTLEYNRFIEVKSYRGEGIEFYWSKKQIEVSRIKRDNYWIYFIGNMNDSTNLDSMNLLKIRFPYKNIIKSKKWFNKEVEKYIISGNIKCVKLFLDKKESVI